MFESAPWDEDERPLALYVVQAVAWLFCCVPLLALVLLRSVSAQLPFHVEDIASWPVLVGAAIVGTITWVAVALLLHFRRRAGGILFGVLAAMSLFAAVTRSGIMSVRALLPAALLWALVAAWRNLRW